MKRREFVRTTLFLTGSAALGCTPPSSDPRDGGSSAHDAASPAIDAPRSDAGRAVSTALPVLTLHAAVTGRATYATAVAPLEGAVPSGQEIYSVDDPTLRSSVLSRWPDGSASLVVLAGALDVEAGREAPLRLSVGDASTGQARTASSVGEILTEVSVALEGIGAARFTAFDTPERIWWSNEQVICARYRSAVGADATLEAVVDVHAYAGGRAWVEIVLENGKIAAADPAPTAPPTKRYAATVTVNGEMVSTVDGAAGPNGGHEAFRAWYASHWVGGDPQAQVTHEAEALQRHPLLFKTWKPGGDMSAYADDAYTPWTVGRHPEAGLASGGDSPQIGPLPLWECHYLQTGSPMAQRAVVASALGMLTFNVSYRDARTGRVPLLGDVHPKRMSGISDWPSTASEPTIDGGGAHHGAAGLLAFLSRPSPVFIEIAQKLATWNGTNFSTDGVFDTDYQQRGYAWCMRSLAHAIFLTPDGDPWKSSARQDLHANVQRGLGFMTSPLNTLDFIWDDTLGGPYDFESDPGMQQPTFMVAYQVTEIPKVAGAKLLDGAQQADLDRLADWICRFPVRFVNEAVGGEWRAVGASRLTVSSDSTRFAESNWAEVQAFQYRDSAGPPPESGPWLEGRGETRYDALYEQTLGGANYSSYFWAALVIATERDIDGAAAAWARVTSGISNLDAWSEGFASDPRWGAYPRNR